MHKKLMMHVYCETYGCTANRGDSELMLGILSKRGHSPVRGLKEADVVIVNTCAVKGTTYRKMLKRLQELNRVGKPVIVTGCLPMIDFNSTRKAGSFAAVLSCRSLTQIGDIVERVRDGETGIELLDGEKVEKPCFPKLRSSAVSAIVQIGEGCLSACTFCSVKLARGGLRSFKPENIVSEVKAAIRAGHREILLTSQDTAAYGRDISSSLPELIHSLTTLEGSFKIRIGMMNPAHVRPILPRLLKAYDNEKVYKFLHLPLQSGDDRILEMMGRGHTVRDFLEIVRSFRRKFRDLYLATDLIVGFPTETEEEFERTIEVIKRVKPDKTNISRFSPMPGTPAAGMPQLEGREIARRSRILSEICRRITYERNIEYVGWRGEALVTERGWKGRYVTRLPNYKLAILEEARLGELVEVRIVDAKPTYLMAERVS